MIPMPFATPAVTPAPIVVMIPVIVLIIFPVMTPPFIYRAIVFIVTTITIVTVPRRIVIISGIRIRLLVNYFRRCGSVWFLVYHRRGRRCVVDPAYGDSESYMSAYIYLRITCGSYQAASYDGEGD
jgi:hypothetical protein